MGNIYLLKGVATFLVLTFTQSALGLGNLENPASGATYSGIGLISGWHCNAERVEIIFDDRPPKVAAHGAVRMDTEPVCGDPDNGFGLLWAYNLLGEGQHRIRAYADGVQFADVYFNVGVINDGDFLRGASGSFGLANFPETGTDTGVIWTQSTQNFSITGSYPSTGGGTALKYLSPIVEDSDGNDLGTLISEENYHMLIYTVQGYLFKVSLLDGSLEMVVAIYFDQENCQGNAYAANYYSGRVFRMQLDGYPLFYVPDSAVEEDVQIMSYVYDDKLDCFYLPHSRAYMPAYPNAPAITGVANKGTPTDPYPLPMRLTRP